MYDVQDRKGPILRSFSEVRQEISHVLNSGVSRVLWGFEEILDAWDCFRADFGWLYEKMYNGTEAEVGPAILYQHYSDVARGLRTLRDMLNNCYIRTFFACSTEALSLISAGELAGRLMKLRSNDEDLKKFRALRERLVKMKKRVDSRLRSPPMLLIPLVAFLKAYEELEKGSGVLLDRWEAWAVRQARRAA